LFGYSGTLKIIPRAVVQLDYTPGNGSAVDIGGDDLIHGESGDDQVWTMTGNDVVFGDGQDDDVYGGDGTDRLYGGTHEDGIVGDNGLVITSRNGFTEPLHGLTTVHPEEVLVSGQSSGAVEYIGGRIHKAFTAIAWNDGANDVIYGGLGDDFIHAGAGDDAVSGAEALPGFYNDDLHTNLNPLQYNAATTKFAAYDANNPRLKIAGFLLNFEATDATTGQKVEDGKDRMFGDLGHDWLVGGTGKDRLFGGLGDDLLNADDNHDTAGGLNNAPDAPEFADGDFAYDGGNRDVLIANTGNDRLIDFTGEYNSFIVPFGPFGAPVVERVPSRNGNNSC
jgi:Ca2+-binding RTX toxin-like protein